MTKRRISYLVCLIWLCSAVCLLAKDRTATKASGNATEESAQYILSSPETSGLQSTSEDKPVEQVRKNIQVLKGLPASQLFPLMNFVSASLGVRCAYCHVNQGGGDNWVWESDDKETKRTARQMMRMVLDINKNNLDALRGSGITCFTCHRGQTGAARMPPLPLAVSGHEDGPGRDAKEVLGALPSADQILNRYVEAVGGRAAIAKLKTRVMRGNREASQGRSWPLEITVKEPDKYLMVVNIPQQGEIRQGFNGVTAWVKNSQGGVRELNANELITAKQSVELSKVIKISEPFPRMTVTGKEKVGNGEAYVLEYSPAEGVTEKLFFDVKTGLLLRRLTLRSTVLTPIPEQIDFEDYREVDGVKLPFTIRISNIDTYFSLTRRLTEIKHNVAVDDAQFNKPSIKPARGAAQQLTQPERGIALISSARLALFLQFVASG